MAKDDLDEVIEIYEAAVPTLATMDTEPPDPGYWDRWLREHQDGARHCAFVHCDEDGRVRGYVSLSPFASRGGYASSAEISIYIAPGHRSAGLGDALCEFITLEAARRGLTMVIAMMTSNNLRSRKILARNRYEYVGRVNGIAVKNRTLIDMEIWQFPIPKNWTGLERLEES